jgi:DNA-binding transcriptional MerR regulator
VSPEPLLTISAFARAVELAPSTLRYYDEAGLLPPAEVDPRTGYRYYTPELERRATLVRRMRDVGVPVEAMRVVLTGPPERAAAVLGGFAERAARNAEQAYAVVEEIVSVLHSERSTRRVAVTVDGPELAAAVRAVSRAAAEHETPLRGVLLDVGGGTLTAVATDRYWLAHWSVSVVEAQTPERRAFIPIDSVEELASRLEHNDAVTIELAADAVSICGETDAVPTAAADDRFPAYRLIIPGRGLRVGRATFDRSSLATMLSAADDRAIRIAVAPGRLGVSRLGESDATRIDAVTSGASTTLWFSAGLLRRALDTMVGSAVSLVYSGPDRPVQLIPIAQNRLGVLLMPGRPDA